MIPDLGCSPKINVLTIGAEILTRLSNEPIAINDLLYNLPKELDLSIDHIILSTDWLFALGTISIVDDRVTINVSD